MLPISAMMLKSQHLLLLNTLAVLMVCFPLFSYVYWLINVIYTESKYFYFILSFVSCDQPKDYSK